MLDYYIKNKSSINSLQLFTVFYKWRKTILVVIGIAAISSSVVSFMIPEKYKSTVVLFPASPVSVSKSLISQNNSPQTDLLKFGEEEDIERMLQVLNSQVIRDIVIEKYNLLEHYQIPAGSRYKKTILNREYKNNIQFKKTEFMSVKIEVLDSDPQVAANMANDIAALYDSTMTRMKKVRAMDAYNIISNEYAILQNEIKTKEDSLHKLMQLGVNDYESQAERLNEALGKAIIEGKTTAVNTLEQKIKMLSTYGISYMSIRDNLYRMREQSISLKEKLEQAKVDANENISEKFIVDSAYPAEKNSYPIKWLIVTIATFSSLIVTLIAVALIENIKTYQKTTRNTLISEKF